MKKVFEEVRVLTREEILPKQYQNEANPFLLDYFTTQKLLDTRGLSLAHFNGNPFGLTVRNLINKFYGAPKIFVTVPAHNLEESIREFGVHGMQYPFAHMTDPYLWQLYTSHIRMADTVICPSRLSADYLKNKLSLPEEKFRIIPHGCDLPSEIPPYPDGCPPYAIQFTVGHLGQNGPDKGQRYLMESMYRLWTRPKGCSSALVLAGQGTEAWRGGQGYIKDPADVYRSCSVYVQPSVTEGFGIPVLEAMAYARPVIVTDGCGVSELVEDGKDGFVVPIRSPEKIAEKLMYFKDNPSEVEKMGRNARLKAEQYTWDKIEDMYQKLYTELLP